MSEEGEFPKIFPFSKFNLDNVSGNYDRNPDGTFIFKKNSKGELVDNDGNLVNSKGYLIDKDGNLIDKRGNKMLPNNVMDADGEVPKIFRSGLLRSKSMESFSKLMSEDDNRSAY